MRININLFGFTFCYIMQNSELALQRKQAAEVAANEIAGNYAGVVG